MHADQVDVTADVVAMLVAAQFPQWRALVGWPAARGGCRGADVCVGDPAVDLMPAWNLLDAGSRETYRRALGVEDATWERGRGWALVQAINALPYYVETNPVMADPARRTLRAALD